MNPSAVTSTFASDLRALLRLAVPIVAVQVGLMSMGVVDAIFLGHVSATDLAAAALGTLYFFGVGMFGIGLLMALDPVISQAVGARDQPAIARGLQRGVVLATLISLPAAGLCLIAEPVLRMLGQPETVVPRAAAFVRVAAPGMLPFLLFGVMRFSLQAMKRTREVLITIVLANGLNAFLNWVFVFGNLGAPVMGAAGSALSTVFGRWFMMTLLLTLSWAELRRHLLPWDPESLRPAPLARMIAIGAPIGGQIALEIGSFATIALLAGRFGAEAMAGHQIAINLASFMYMVPLGVGNAAAVLVGHAIGEGDVRHVRRLARVALTCGGGFMACSAALMLLAPALFARVYTNVPGVIAVALTLIPIAGVFQVFDGLQVVASGILRGAGDTKSPLVISVLGFWCVGVPVSLWAAYRAELGVVGLWWGFVAGLVAVAAFLLWRVRAKLGGPLARLHVDAPVERAAAPSVSPPETSPTS